MGGDYSNFTASLKRIYGEEYFEKMLEKDSEFAKFAITMKAMKKPFEIIWDRVIDMRPHA